MLVSLMLSGHGASARGLASALSAAASAPGWKACLE